MMRPACNYGIRKSARDSLPRNDELLLCGAVQREVAANVIVNTLWSATEYKLQGMRKTKDSIGDMQVPDLALWGASTQRAVLNFPISGHRLPAGFIRALGLVKLAAARANEELAHLSADKSRLIQLAAREVAAGEHADQFPVDVFQTGSGTSTNTNANEFFCTS